jgi:autotransporter-associated beta strand protein
MKTRMAGLMGALCAVFVGAAQAGVIVKANNTDALSAGSSWVGGAAPGADDVALWDGSVTNGYTVALGAPLSWLGMSVAAGTLSNLTVSGSQTLTLGAAGLTTVPDKGLTFNCALALACGQTWNVANNTLIPQGGVDLGGFTLALSGGGTKQFKSLISGGGRITNQGGAIKFTNAGTAAPDTDITLTAANITFETSTGLATGPRTKSMTLNGGSVNVGARTTANTVETNANELVVGPGAVSTVTITPSAFRSAMLYSGSLVREAGSVINFRGTGLGTNTLASLTPNSVNVALGSAPALVGGNGGPDSTTNGILVGVLVDTTTGGSGMGLATYDADYGIRLLNPLTEFTGAITDGQSQLDNVRLTNAVNTILTNTLASATTVNSLSFRVDAGALTQCGIRVTGAGPLKLNSGTIAGTVNATAVSVTNSFYLDVATLDLNGQEGVFAACGTGAQGGGSHSGAMLDLACSITNDGGKGVTVSGSVVKFSGSSTNRYTGDTRCTSGFLWLAKSGSPLPGNLVVNGGSVQNSGNQIADNCDLYVYGGAYALKGGDWNSGSGQSDTFRDLYLMGGTHTSGASGTSSGSTTLSNAVVAGGTWNVTRGHFATVRGWLNLSGGTIVYSGTTDSTSGGRLVLGGALVITNTASGAYTCMTLGNSSGTGNPSRLTLSNDVTFVGHPANASAVVVAAPAGVKTGQILLSGARLFDIGDGPASADLVLEPLIVNNGTVVGSLTKTGAGTLALYGTNAYTGATTVDAGALAVNGSVASPVTVRSGAALSGTGVVSVASGAAVTIEAGGVVDPGAVGAVGALSVAGDVSFSGSAVLRVDVDGAACDLLAVTGTVTGGGAVVQKVGEGAGPWRVLTAAQITGTFTAAPSAYSVYKLANDTELWLGKRRGTLIGVL